MTTEDTFLLPFLGLASVPGLWETYLCAHTQDSPQ